MKYKIYHYIVHFSEEEKDRLYATETTDYKSKRIKDNTIGSHLYSIIRNPDTNFKLYATQTMEAQCRDNLITKVINYVNQYSNMKYSKFSSSMLSSNYLRSKLPQKYSRTRRQIYNRYIRKSSPKSDRAAIRYNTNIFCVIMHYNQISQSGHIFMSTCVPLISKRWLKNHDENPRNSDKLNKRKK